MTNNDKSQKIKSQNKNNNRKDLHLGQERIKGVYYSRYLEVILNKEENSRNEMLQRVNKRWVVINYWIEWDEGNKKLTMLTKEEIVYCSLLRTF